MWLNQKLIFNKFIWDYGMDKKSHIIISLENEIIHLCCNLKVIG